MMTRYLAFLVLLIFIGLFIVFPVSSQSNGIIVDDADATRDEFLGVFPSTPSPPPRIIVQYANDIAPFPYGAFTGPTYVLPRIIILHANTNRTIPLEYPAGLIDDNFPPQISGLTYSEDEFGNVHIIWFTDEYTDATVVYGTQSGAYPYTIYDPLYIHRHEIILSNLTPCTTYYFKVSNVDRSGNSAESGEYDFTTTCPTPTPTTTPTATTTPTFTSTLEWIKNRIYMPLLER